MKISILGVFLFFIAGLAFAQTPVIALLSKTTPAEMVWERSLFTAFFLFGFIKFGFLIRLKLLSETSVRPNRIYEAYVGLWGAINTALFLRAAF